LGRSGGVNLCGNLLMTLRTHILNDVSRCTGGDGEQEICPQREACARWVFRTTGGAFAPIQNFHRPGDLLGCMDKIEMEIEG